MANLKKLAKLKSEFLLLPEYFSSHITPKNYQDLFDASAQTEKWLLQLSRAYKGTIIGGSLFHNEDDKTYLGIPILNGGSIIAWYNKQNLSREEQKTASQGKTEKENVFVLAGVRFAVLFYSDIRKDYLSSLAEEGIRLIFAFGSFPSSGRKNNISKSLTEHCQEFQCNIVLCSGVGSHFEYGSLIGQSLITTPYGLSWQLSENERNDELIKTVMVNYSN